ncbi:MAG: protein BatD [bacterium]|nr:protein BatD [bacterium]
MSKRIFIFSLVNVLLIGLIFAAAIVTQGITVYSDVDSTSIGIDEQVTLKLTIAGSGFFKTPKLPKTPNFSVILVGQFTSIDFSQGKPIPYTVFKYMFMPHKKGTLEIPAIFFKHKGYYYSSEKYQIKVGDKLRKVKHKESSIPYQSFRGQVESTPIFVRSYITRFANNNVFYNQQIVYTYTIYTRVPIRKIPEIKIPDYEAFHREPLYYRKEYMTEINGKTYRAFEFKFSLFPYMTNTHIIPPIRMVVRRSDIAKSARNQLHFPKQGYFIKKSQSFKLNINELPIKNKPLAFSGLVGSFEIKAEVDKTEVEVDDYIILTVKVKGSGNIRSIPHIKCPLIANLREYNSDIFMNFDKKSGKIEGEKLFKFALLPREKGLETISEIGFSYFDEDSGVYLTKWTKSIEIKVIEKQDDPLKEKGFPAKKNNYMLYLLGGVVLAFIGILLFLGRK